MTLSPSVDEGTSVRWSLCRSESISSTARSRRSMETGRFSQALTSPLRIFSLLMLWRVLSRLTTRSSVRSICS